MIDRLIDALQKATRLSQELGDEGVFDDATGCRIADYRTRIEQRREVETRAVAMH